VTVESALDSTGTLLAAGGTIVLQGAVTGSGTGEISNGTLEAASTFDQNVAFNSAKGVLELAHSETYAGAVSGLSSAGTNSLDLEDIPFVSGTTSWSFSGTSASGVLTVKDGSHVAAIKLTGDYLTAKFTLASDAHGGTSVVDPAGASASASATTARFAAAIASFAAPPAEMSRHAADGLHAGRPALAVPRMMQAV